MQIRRFKDIVAFKNDTSELFKDSIVAFHSANMEVAEISEEAFGEMTEIDLLTGEIPENKAAIDADAKSDLTEWNLETNPNVKSGKMDFDIKSLTINVNQICNLKCAYCAAGGDGTYGEPMNQISVEKTLPQIKFFMSKLREGDTFSISFVGGEPMLHPIAVKAIHDYTINEAKNMKLKTYMKIVTNGTLLHGETLEILRSMSIKLLISFDGIKEKNDLVRPSKDGSSPTDKILQAIKELNTNRGSIISIEITAVSSSKNNNIIENYSFLNSLGCNYLDFVFAYEEKDLELQYTYINQMISIADIAWKNGGEQELRKIKIFDVYFNLLDNQLTTENHCGAGKNYLKMDAKNRLFACAWDNNESNEVVGLGEQIYKEKLSKYSKSLVELNNCASCWAKNICGGGCMYINKSHSGSAHTKSILFCERTRSLISTAVLYYKLARSIVSNETLG